MDTTFRHAQRFGSKNLDEELDGGVLASLELIRFLPLSMKYGIAFKLFRVGSELFYLGTTIYWNP